MTSDEQVLILSLQKELADVEDELDMWRKEYNKAMAEVVRLNDMLEALQDKADKPKEKTISQMFKDKIAEAATRWKKT